MRGLLTLSIWLTIGQLTHVKIYLYIQTIFDAAIDMVCCLNFMAFNFIQMLIRVILSTAYFIAHLIWLMIQTNMLTKQHQ